MYYFTLFSTNRFNFSCWRTGINMARFANGIFQHHGARCDEAIFTHKSLVHNNSPHPNQHPVLQGTSMHDGTMANVHKIADLCSGLPVGTMYDGTVLNVSAVANADIIHIATHHRIKPKTTIVSGYYIPYNGGVSCNETILA